MAVAGAAGLGVAVGLIAWLIAPAASIGAATCSNEAVRAAQSATSLPDCRAYEMVSPLDKNGESINRNLSEDLFSTSGASSKGGAVAYGTRGSTSENGSGAPWGQYRSVRGATGWLTRGIDPPLDLDPDLTLNSPWIYSLSDDLSKTVVATNALLSPRASMLGGSRGLYLQDNDASTGKYQLLSDPFAALPADPDFSLFRHRFHFSGASKDMRHVVFNSWGRPLVPEAPQEDSSAVYEWTGGKVRLVSVLPDGTPVTGAHAFGGTTDSNNGGAETYPGDHLISDDGKRIFFTTNGALYVREAGTTTRLLSGSEREGDDPTVGRSANFEAAKADDGSLAVFTSGTQLTEGATATDAARDLYLWSAQPTDGKHLVDLTTGDPNGGGALNIAAASDDLSYVYFAATGDLAEGAVPGSVNLYLWHIGEGVRHVTALGPNDAAVWSVRRSEATGRFRDARISGDGTRLLFTSSASQTGYDTADHKQVFLYDSSTDEMECVSCSPISATSTGDAGLFPIEASAESLSPWSPARLTRNLSTDGRRVVFETTEALVSSDSNGSSDVYQWADGAVALISSGRDAGGAQFVDADAAGRDVFFTTRERLVAADRDNQVDVYDARVEGGFPVQQEMPCEGDTCQGARLQPPVLANLSSESLRGRGNVSPKPRAAFSLRRLSARQRAKLARGGSVVLSVRVNRAGRVSAIARAMLGKRVRTVVSASQRAKRAGTIELRLRLTRAARDHLEAAGSLRAVLRVRFAGTARLKALSLNLRARGSSNGR